MLSRMTSNGAYGIGLAAALVSALLVVVVALGQAVERIQVLA